MKPMRFLLVAVLCAVALAACSRSGTRQALSAPSGAAEDRKAEASAPAEADQLRAPSSSQAAGGGAGGVAGSVAGSVANLPQERMVIKSATLAVRVNNVPSAFARAVQLAETSGGYIQTSTESAEGGERADVTIRVPPHGFLPLIASLEALGAPSTKTISGEDVTQEYYDLAGELENQMEVRGRLFQLLRQAVKVTDAIAVEEQLERIGANVNRIKGRMKYLETMTGMSTISLSLYSDARPASEGFINWSLVGHGFFRAAQILVSAFFILLQVLVVAIPLALVLGAAAWGVLLLVRLIRARQSLPAKRRK